MSTVKTSQAVILTARLNPINPQEASALQILEEQKKRGLNFKQVAVDAINFAAGRTPEMFTRDEDKQAERFAQLTEEVFKQYADQLLDAIQNGKVRNGKPKSTEDEAGEPLSSFTRTFVKGVMQRQQQTLDTDDE